jgi:hypothetical protein
MRMKTNLFMLFVALSFGVFASCTSDEVTKVDSRLSIDNADENGLLVCSVTSKAQSKTVSFTSSTDWKAYVPKDVDWITVTPSSGSASSEAQTVSIAINANSLTEARTAYVDFICDKLQQKSRVEITQAQLYTLSVSTPKNVINKKGGDVVISVEANSEWTYSMDDAAKEWLTEKAIGATALTLSATPLVDVTKEKTGVITFTSSADPTITATLTLYEKDVDLVIKGTQAMAPSVACSGSVAVTTTNVADWVASSSDNWITATKASANSLGISVSANPTDNPRTGSVSVTASDDKTVTMSIPVYQAGKGVTADMLDIEYASDGTAKDVSATANEITYVSGTGCSVAYNKTYGRYVPSFTHAMNSTGSTGFYYLPLTDDAQAKLDKGFTVEMVMEIAIDHTGVETKSFSSTSGGGIATMIATDGNLTFLINLNTGRTPSSWRWINGSGKNVPGDNVKTPVKVEKEKYYHLVGVWDKAKGTASCYIDGVKISECTGMGEYDIRYAQTTPRFWCVGCNPVVKSGAVTGFNGGWYGDVPITRLYSTVLTEDQVKAQYLSSFATPSIIIK